MKRILFIYPYYLPGFRSGGPQQTLQNISDVFGDSTIEVYILALNHDMGDCTVYPDIQPGWNKVGNANVMYVDDTDYNMTTIMSIIDDMDMVYACSLFSKYTIRVILAHKQNKFNIPLVVAPMGVLASGAMNQKNLKKRLFLLFFRLFRLHKGTIWSVTSDLEKAELLRHIPKASNIFIAEDIPRKYVDFTDKRTYDKLSGELHLAFLSRISPQKNLWLALEALALVKATVVFDIYGPIEDSSYWTKCLALMEHLPPNITCDYRGAVHTSETVTTLSRYHCFILPTLGENFGHVIYEALVAGCIPVISDTTPWADISTHTAGSVLSLQAELFAQEIEKVASLNLTEFKKASLQSISYAKYKYNQSISNSGYTKIFDL